MATVFQRTRSDVWVAAFRVWDAASGKWRWMQKGTGTTDRSKALLMAASWETAAVDAQAGRMTRERAFAVVNDILRLAGLEEIHERPSVSNVLDGLMEGKDVAASTARKYEAQAKSLREWAGPRMSQPVDVWTADTVAEYYRWLKGRFAATTANDHLRFVSSLFARAVALGHRTGNPVEAVATASNDSVERIGIQRGKTARLLRHLRRVGRRDWCTLVGLGWHTGHRLQDLLDVTDSAVKHDAALGWLVTIQPRKKGAKGRAVILPVPAWLARSIRRLRSFATIHGADNRSGRVSGEFIHWLRACGIDPKPTKRGARIIHLISFHSFRHAMASRLAAAGVSGELARLVTDHDSPTVHRQYVHAEISAVSAALRAARRM